MSAGYLIGVAQAKERSDQLLREERAAREQDDIPSLDWDDITRQVMQGEAEGDEEAHEVRGLAHRQLPTGLHELQTARLPGYEGSTASASPMGVGGSMTELDSEGVPIGAVGWMSSTQHFHTGSAEVSGTGTGTDGDAGRMMRGSYGTGGSQLLLDAAGTDSTSTLPS